MFGMTRPSREPTTYHMRRTRLALLSHRDPVSKIKPLNMHALWIYQLTLAQRLIGTAGPGLHFILEKLNFKKG